MLTYVFHFLRFSRKDRRELCWTTVYCSSNHCLGPAVYYWLHWTQWISRKKKLILLCCDLRSVTQCPFLYYIWKATTALYVMYLLFLWFGVWVLYVSFVCFSTLICLSLSRMIAYWKSLTSATMSKRAVKKPTPLSSSCSKCSDRAPTERYGRKIQPKYWGLSIIP